MPKNLILTVAIMLIIAIAPFPYAYYEFLRVVGCGFFAWATCISYSRNMENVWWVFAMLMVLFNPIFPIHLPRELWLPIDVASGVFILFNMKKLMKEKLTTVEDEADFQSDDSSGIDIQDINVGMSASKAFIVTMICVGLLAIIMALGK